MKVGSLLNPSDGEIKKYVEKYETKWGYRDRLIYYACVTDTGKKALCKIKKDDLKGPVSVFLLDWGMMRRVLGRKEKKGWENFLWEFLRLNCEKLEEYRKPYLKDIEISEHEDNIRYFYKGIRDIIGPVSASKVLHLINQNLFPLWDTKIREKISEESSNSGGKRIGTTSFGYIKFLAAIKKVLNEHNEVLSRLSKQHNLSKLKILDEFLMGVLEEKEE
jgi:hypothetical protein